MTLTGPRRLVSDLSPDTKYILHLSGAFNSLECRVQQLHLRRRGRLLISWPSVSLNGSV